MTEVKLQLPDALAELVARRAAALGTTPEHWVQAMVEDLAADLPEDGEGPDGWICR